MPASPSRATSTRSRSITMERSEEHTSELQSHHDITVVPTRRSSDLAIGNQVYHNVFYGNNLLRDLVNSNGAIALREWDGRSVRDNLVANNIFFRNAGFAFEGNVYTITINHYGKIGRAHV